MVFDELNLRASSTNQESTDVNQEVDAIDITVILCTYNRCGSLAEALESVAAQTLPDRVKWEVIVVDNNSRDETRTVVEQYCQRFPSRFRYAFEGEQGLSRARNAGIRAARGQIIAFLDDDVIAEPDWLGRLTQSLHDDTWAGAGGRIAPPIGFQPPAWLPLGGKYDLGGTLALFDLGDEAAELKRAPYGTNMAFRTSVFKRCGMFRTDLGRCGNALLSGEDTEFGNRLFAAGLRLRYEPAAIVHHPVSEERLKKRYFDSWWFNFGRTRIIERVARPALLGIPREYLSAIHLLFRLLPVRVAFWSCCWNARQRAYRRCQVMMTLGEIVQNLRRARTQARKQTGSSLQNSGLT